MQILLLIVGRKKTYQDGLENCNQYFSILNMRPKIQSNEDDRKMCSILLIFGKSTRKYSTQMYVVYEKLMISRNVRFPVKNRSKNCIIWTSALAILQCFFLMICSSSLTYTECILNFGENSGLPSVYVTRRTAHGVFRQQNSGRWSPVHPFLFFFFFFSFLSEYLCVVFPADKQQKQEKLHVCKHCNENPI
jgi:hypothetical protein